MVGHQVIIYNFDFLLRILNNIFKYKAPLKRGYALFLIVIYHHANQYHLFLVKLK